MEQPRLLVFATTQDKDVRGMMALLLPQFDSVLLTRYNNNPRGVPVAELLAIAQELGHSHCCGVTDSAAAWEAARVQLSSKHLLCVTGSFFNRRRNAGPDGTQSPRASRSVLSGRRDRSSRLLAATARRRRKRHKPSNKGQARCNRKTLQSGFAILIGGAVLAATATAQPSDENAPAITAARGRLGSFFEGLIEGRTSDAYKDLLAGGPLARTDRQSQREQLVKKTTELETTYGRPMAYEALTLKKIGTDVVVCKYLYKCENFPVVWHIVF